MSKKKETKQGTPTEETKTEAKDLHNVDAKATENEAVVENVDTLQDQLNEMKDKYLRLFAEFDNYKKRTIKERLETMKMAAQDTVAALLPVLDDFDRAKKNAEHFSEGVALVYHKLYSILKQKGLEPMDSDGQPFDPELHEAITEIPAPSEELKGKVVDTIERGYRLNDRIIRHAKVVVGK